LAARGGTLTDLQKLLSVLDILNDGDLNGSCGTRQGKSLINLNDGEQSNSGREE
jgi:hypothetical protein